MSELIKGWLLAIASFFLLYLVSILISRWLGPSAFGDYSVAIASVTIIATAATLGLEKLSLNELPVYQQHLKWNLYYGFLRRTIGLIIIISVILALISLGVFEFYEIVFKTPINHPSRLILSYFIPIIALVYILTELLAANERYVSSVFVYRFQYSAVALILLVLLHFFFDNFAVKHAIFAYGLSWVVCIITSILILIKILPIEIWGVKPEYKTRYWLSKSYSFFVNTMVFTALNYSGIIILELFNESENVVGIYGAVAQTSFFLIMFMSTSNEYFLPRISEALDNEDSTNINKLL